MLGKSVKDAYIQTIKGMPFRYLFLAAESNASKLGSSNSPAVAQVSSTLSMDEAGKILNLPLPGSTLDQAKEVLLVKWSPCRNLKSTSNQMPERMTGMDRSTFNQNLSGPMSVLRRNQESTPKEFLPPRSLPPSRRHCTIVVRLFISYPFLSIDQ